MAIKKSKKKAARKSPVSKPATRKGVGSGSKTSGSKVAGSKVVGSGRDALGRKRHANMSGGARALAKPGQADGGGGMREPAHLGILGKKAFRKLSGMLGEKGFLDSADETLIELFAAAYEDWRIARADVLENGFASYEEGSGGFLIKKKNPAVDVQQDAWKRMRSLIPEFGISPSARAKLAGTVGPAELDPLEAFLARRN